MAIDFVCPTCGRSIIVADGDTGKTIRCPGCSSASFVAAPIFDAEELVPTKTSAGISKTFNPVSAAPSPRENAEDEDRKPCPVCGERIVVTARKCRYCGEIFDESLRTEALEPRPEGLELTVVDYLVAILCSVVGLFTGFIWLLQRKPAALRMLGVSALSMAAWSLLSIIVNLLSK